MSVPAWVVLLAALEGAGASIAEEVSGQIWLISTRELADDCQATGAVPRYWLFGADQQWAPSDEKAFLAAGHVAVPTIFVVHGNRADRDEAVSLGWDVLQCLRDEAPGRTFRLAIWSWPADRIQARFRIDVRTKSARSEQESYHLARLIDAMKPDAPVSLVGYSFGARTIGGALNLLAGEAWAGRTLPERKGKPPRMVRAVLVAAAADDSVLLPSGSYACALGQVEQMLVTVNPTDNRLKWYRHLDRRGGPDALGLFGPACPDRLGPDEKKLEVLNLRCEVGRDHTWASYVGAPSLRSRLAKYAFLGQSAETAASAAKAPGVTAFAGANVPAEPKAGRIADDGR
jgi:hypothetical protein